MREPSNPEKMGCGVVQELIVWSPGGRLDEDELRLVEDHASVCSECAGLWRFAQDLKRRAVVKYAPHPDTETLVIFAEDRSQVGAERRSIIDDHLASCSQCRAKVAMLQEVDRDEAAAELDRVSAAGADATDRQVEGKGRPGTLWGFLTARLLRPVPAAVYLTVAVAAVLLLVGPGRQVGPFVDGRAIMTPSLDSNGSLPQVSILPDETLNLRELDAREGVAITIRADQPQFLLLELMGLEEPPLDDDTFTIEVLRNGSSEPILTATASGKAIQESYTIGIPIGARTLQPGAYTITVVDPEGKKVYQSHLSVR